MKSLRPAFFTPGIHILVWGFLLGILSVMFHNQNLFGLSKFFFLATSIFHIGLFYFNAYFLYPRLLTRRRWWLYIPAIAVLVGLAYYAKLFFLALNPGFLLTPENKRIVFFGLIPFLVASIIFRLVSDRIRFEKMEKEARAERLAAELKFLRSQVSPHFLFNIMTNLVSLARKKSDLLEPSLIKLSELLRYMLYDSNEEKISLSRETEHLENYIVLQQLRFGDDVKIEFEMTNDCPGCLVEPMLLVPFIENAFKHGPGMLESPYIKIQLHIKEKLLHFTVINNYNSDNTSKDKNSGIGLANVKNRLEILYPGKYELRIHDDQGIFSVHLNLDLS